MSRQLIEETLRTLQDDDYLNQPLHGTASSEPRSIKRTPPNLSLPKSSSRFNPNSSQAFSSSYGAENPNPNKWLPTSHYPKKKRLTAEKRQQDKKKVSDPFIDKFIEEIANAMVSGATASEDEEKKDNEREEAPEHLKEKLYDVFDKVNKDKRNYLPKPARVDSGTFKSNGSATHGAQPLPPPPLPPQEHQQTQNTFGEFADSFGATMEKMSVIDLECSGVKRKNEASVRRSQQMAGRKGPSTSTTKVSSSIFKNSHMFSPNHAHHDYEFDNKQQQQKFSSSVLDGMKRTKGNLFDMISSRYGRSTGSSSTTSSQQDDANVANLYHIMNIAFLLIEEERSQYTDQLEHARTTLMRGRDLAAICIFTRLKVWCERIVLRRFKQWHRETAVSTTIAKAVKVRKMATTKYFFDRWNEDLVKVRRRLRGFINRMVMGVSFRTLKGGFEQLKRRALNVQISLQLSEYHEMKERLALLTTNFELLQRDTLFSITKKESDDEERKNITLRKAVYKFMANQTGSALILWREKVHLWAHQESTMLRVARRWQLRHTSKCLNEWKDFCANRKFLRYFMVRMVGGKKMIILGAAFDHFKRIATKLKQEGITLECDNLRKRVEELEEQMIAQKLAHNSDKLKRLMKSMDVLDSRVLEKCFMAWIGLVETRHEETLRSTRFFAKLLRSLETRCFNNWRIFSTDSRRKKRKVYAVCSRIVFSSMASGFSAWIDFLAEKKKYETILLRFSTKLRFGAFSRCFLTWSRNVSQIKRERNLIHKFSMRMQNRALYGAFDGLARNASHQRGLKIMFFKALCRICNAKLASAFVAWGIFVREERFREENKGRVLTTEESKKEWQDRMLKKSVAKMLRGALARVLGRWIEFYNGRKHQRRLVTKIFSKMCNKNLSCGWESWASFCREKKREEFVVRKIVTRMRMKLVVMCFSGWREGVSEVKRYKVLVGRFGRKLALRCVLGAFNSWADFRAKRRWVRGLLRKMIGGQELQQQNSAFNSWVGFIEFEKSKDGARRDTVKKIYRMLDHMKKSEGERELMKRTLQWGFGKWLLNTVKHEAGSESKDGREEKDDTVNYAAMSTSLNLGTIERINNYMAMFSHAFGSVEQLHSLFAVTAVSISHMIRNARGCLFLLDTKQRELFTINKTSVLRLPFRGIVGHTARTGESILCERDARSHHLYFSGVDKWANESEIVARGGGKVVSIGKGEENGGNTALVTVAIRSAQGNVVGVLTASFVYDEGDTGQKFFIHEDPFVLSILGSFVAANLEKISAAKSNSAVKGVLRSSEKALQKFSARHVHSPAPVLKTPDKVSWSSGGRGKKMGYK